MAKPKIVEKMKLRLMALFCLLPSVAAAHGFLAGTMVHVPNGQVPIESLQPGDEIMACDESTCRPGIVTQKSMKLVLGYIEAMINGETFYLSDAHPIWDEDTNAWTEASAYAVRSIEHATWLYNIEVAEEHNYHVGNGTLVHNWSAPLELELSKLPGRDQAMVLIMAEAEKVGLHNPAQLAYILATAEHETMGFATMSEIGGKNKPYAPYYGRGYVQLTHSANYKKYGEILNVDLLGSPDLALDKKRSAFIIVHGMLHGEFTGKKLVKYITGLGNGKGSVDFIRARRVVNGNFHADRVAELAKKWMQYLRKHRYGQYAESLSWLYWSAYHDEL